MTTKKQARETRRARLTAARAAAVQSPEQGEPEAPESNRRFFSGPQSLLALTLGLLVAVSFFPAYQAGFVWDDVVFTEEPVIRSTSGLKNIWLSPADIQNEGHYWPVTYTTFWLEHKLWGLAPLGYHIVNVLLHLANVLLLWRLLGRLSVPGAWIAAAVYAVHPLHVESVVWVIERKDVLSGLFYLGSLLTYIRFVETRRWPAYALALALFVAGLLSKSVIVTLPAALLIWHWWKRDRISKADVLTTAPFFFAGLAITLGDMAFYRSREVLSLDYSLVERVLIAARAVWFYVGKLIWPTDLAVIYPLWEIRTGDLLAWTFVTASVALPVGLWLGRHRIGRGPLMGLAFFAVTLSPALGFVDYGYMQFSFVADRYQYLAGAGVIAVVVAAAVRGAAGLSASYAIAGRVLLAAVLVILGTLTWRQASIYRNSIAFFSHIVALNPGARNAHLNLAQALGEADRFEESLEASRIAVAQRPDFPGTHSNQGLALLNLNRFDEAEAAFARALELNPRYRNGHQNLGEAMTRQGRYQEAAEQFRTVLALDDSYSLAWAGLAAALFRARQYDEAAKAGRRALAADPDGPNAGAVHYLLGQTLRELGQAEEAEQNLLRAAELGPDDAGPLLELAIVYGLLQRPQQAEEVLGRARSMQPQSPAPLHARAEALRTSERYQAALAVYREALELDPEFPPAIAGMGIALFELGRRDEAIESLSRALTLDPDQPAAPALHRILGRAQQEAGRTEDAVRQFRRALELDPNETEARGRLAMVHFGQKRYEEALEQYLALLETGGSTPQVHANLGVTLFYLERYGEAILHLERTLELDADQSVARDALNDARRRLERQSQ